MGDSLKGWDFVKSNLLTKVMGLLPGVTSWDILVAMEMAID